MIYVEQPFVSHSDDYLSINIVCLFMLEWKSNLMEYGFKEHKLFCI